MHAPMHQQESHAQSIGPWSGLAFAESEDKQAIYLSRFAMRGYGLPSQGLDQHVPSVFSVNVTLWIPQDQNLQEDAKLKPSRWEGIKIPQYTFNGANKLEVRKNAKGDMETWTELESEPCITKLK